MWMSERPKKQNRDEETMNKAFPILIFGIILVLFLTLLVVMSFVAERKGNVSLSNFENVYLSKKKIYVNEGIVEYKFIYAYNYNFLGSPWTVYSEPITVDMDTYYSYNVGDVMENPNKWGIKEMLEKISFIAFCFFCGFLALILIVGIPILIIRDSRASDKIDEQGGYIVLNKYLADVSSKMTCKMVLGVDITFMGKPYTREYTYTVPLEVFNAYQVGDFFELEYIKTIDQIK